MTIITSTYRFLEMGLVSCFHVKKDVMSKRLFQQTFLVQPYCFPFDIFSAYFSYIFCNHANLEFSKEGVDLSCSSIPMCRCNNALFGRRGLFGILRRPGNCTSSSRHQSSFYGGNKVLTGLFTESTCTRGVHSKLDRRDFPDRWPKRRFVTYYT